ncbi:hypothetical protein [Trueperella pecoris]|uniref:TadE-like protein n=1 Tax=Trueperella pecoris TaxID=2733571 RepID=A0A7M1QTZ0_9ACTO|nr:hypothetical protein [Trueperella pecoris]QOR44994.1 hypothetical protein INS88_06810 [Trueperella pecoris]QTG74894.1 hypothetical protein J4179_06600 [Trueperella pecoris]
MHNASKFRPGGAGPHRQSGEGAEAGNAIVEFVGVMVVVIVPALVLLVGLATTTAAQLALNDAARQSVRAFVRSDSGPLADASARQAAEQAWADRGFTEHLATEVVCASRPCLTPGASVTVNVEAAITIPVLGAVSVKASQAMMVDLYRMVRP